MYPSIGCVVSLKKGYDAGYQGNLPPYITLTNPVGWFSETGFLGQKYKTFATGGDPNSPGFTVNDITPPGGVPDKRLQGRHTLLRSIDSLAKQMDKESVFQTADALDEKAYGMILGDAKKAFDLSGEKNELRDRYGRTGFGQSCLMARRLVQNGVPFVTIHHEGWDTHYDNFAAMKNLVPPLDKGLGTLLEDLAQTGLAQQHHRRLVRRVRPHAQDRLEPAVDGRASSLSVSSTLSWLPAAVSAAAPSSVPATPKGSSPRSGRFVRGT